MTDKRDVRSGVVVVNPDQPTSSGSDAQQKRSTAMDRLRQAVARMSKGETAAPAASRGRAATTQGSTPPTSPAKPPARSQPTASPETPSTVPEPLVTPQAVAEQPPPTAPIPDEPPVQPAAHIPGEAGTPPTTGDEALDTLQDIEDELADIEASANDDVDDDLLTSLQDEFASALGEMGALEDFARLQDEQPLVEPGVENLDFDDDETPSRAAAVDEVDAEPSPIAPPSADDQPSPQVPRQDDVTPSVSPPEAEAVIDQIPGEFDAVPEIAAADNVQADNSSATETDRNGESELAPDLSPVESNDDAGEPQMAAAVEAPPDPADSDADLDMDDLAGAIDDLLSMQHAAPEPRKPKPSPETKRTEPSLDANPSVAGAADANDFDSLAGQIDALLSGDQAPPAEELSAAATAEPQTPTAAEGHAEPVSDVVRAQSDPIDTGAAEAAPQAVTEEPDDADLLISEERDGSLEELDAALADDVDSLLQGDFQAIDSVLDGVFEAQAAVVQHLDDDGEFEAYDPESDSFESASPASSVEPPPVEMIESIADAPSPVEEPVADAPAADAPVVETVMQQPETVAEPAIEAMEPATVSEVPAQSAEEAMSLGELDEVIASDPIDYQAMDRDIDAVDMDALDEPEFDPEPIESSPDDVSDEQFESTPEPVTVSSDSTPQQNPLITVLSLMNYPLRMVPDKARPVVDWAALSLIFWTPIVWAIVLFT